MKRILFFLTIVLSAVVLTGCDMFGGGGSTSYTASDLVGKWVEDDNPQCFWVYSLDKDDSGDYYWGKTWDENDQDESSLVFHGNGWFKWSLSGNKLLQLHVMEISDALVTKSYTISSCTSSTLVLKNSYGTASTYKKVK